MGGGEKRKILFLIDMLKPGGSERQLLMLAEGLPRDKYSPVIGTFDTTPYQESVQKTINTPVVMFKVSGLPVVRSLLRFIKLYKYLRAEQFDIIQLYFPTASIQGCLATRLLRRRPSLIGTRRNLYHWKEEQPFLFWLYKFTSKWDELIIANSIKVAEYSKSYESINADKVIVIDNGIDVDKYQQVTTEQAKKNIGLEGQYPVIGVVGNWRPVKGINYFLDACAKVMQKYPMAKFVIAGFGPQKEELLEQARKIGIYENLTLVEGRTDVEQFIPAFEVAVQSSLAESFSNVLIEYMASARSIVATRVGDAERIIEDGSEGILVNSGNSTQLAQGILKLLDNPELAKHLSAAALKKTYRNWSLDTNIKAYDKLYQSLL